MLTCAFPFHDGDLERSVEWLRWARDLGGCKAHRLILMPAKDMKPHGELVALARETFGTVEVVADVEGIEGWPQAPNSLFRQAAWHCHLNTLGPFLFLENDAIPLVPEWLDRLESEYLAAGKPFMGALVPAVPGPEGYAAHCSGVAIYPQNTVDIAPNLMQAMRVAFDVVGAKDIVPKMHNTRLIQHVFNLAGNPPTFPDANSLALLSADAVLFHRVKDCSLIHRLREELRFAGCGSGQTEAAYVDARPVVNVEIQCHPNAVVAFTPVNIVNTYYEPVEGMDTAEQEGMLARWAESWTQAGFRPVVLNEASAKSHPAFDRFKAAFEALPTVNPKAYELACFMRWVAMVQQGGGLLTDYDVLNYGFTPGDIPANESRMPLILADNNPCPCVVFGDAEQYNRAAALFLNYCPSPEDMEGDSPHVSDQLIVQANVAFVAHDICFQYGRDGWEGAKLVHYAHSACAGRKRSQVIPAAEGVRAIWKGLPEEVLEFPRIVQPVKSVEHFTDREIVEELKRRVEAGKKVAIMNRLDKAGLVKRKVGKRKRLTPMERLRAG